MKDLNSYPVLSNFVLVAPPATAVDTIDLTALHSIPLILSPENSDLKKALAVSMAQYGFDLDLLTPILELDGIESIKSSVRAGHGSSFLPYFTVKKELFSKELKEIKLDGVNLETSFVMVWRKEGKQRRLNGILPPLSKQKGARFASRPLDGPAAKPELPFSDPHLPDAIGHFIDHMLIACFRQMF